MVLVKCPECQEIFEEKYGIRWEKEFPRIPKLVWCTTVCMFKYTRRYEEFQDGSGILHPKT